MKGKLIFCAALLCTGCSGPLVIAGTAEGWRAYNDGQIGLVTDGKATPDKKSAYWQSREQETGVKMLRLKLKGAK